MGGHTKGKAETDGYRVWADVPGSNEQQCIAECRDNDLDKSEQTANAALIAEAFNVAHETGRTPQQLADERAELVSAADAFIYKRTHETLMNLCAILAKVKGPVQS